MTRWLRQLFRSAPTVPVVRAHRTRLGLQRLEERDTPATFNVTVTGDSGAGSLRNAVAQANTTAGADTITFQAGLGNVVLTSNELAITDTTGATTISGTTTGTQVVTRSTAGGTPNFRIFRNPSGVTTVLNNLTISNGNSSDVGGGIYNDGTLTLANSTLSGNTTSLSGGGIASSPTATLTITNSTLSENVASGNGGGIFNGGTLTMTNSTLSTNTAGIGGGIVTNGVATLRNTIVAGNKQGTTANDVYGAVVNTSANNLIGDGTGLTGITNGTGGNQISTGAVPINPLLQPLANNGGVTRTHALGQNSPALGSGSASVAGYLVYDQRGAARDNGTPDIGAYEVNHPLSTVGAPTTLASLFQPKPSASANEAFVKGLYQSTLLRAPDAAGLSGWLALLNSGISRSTVANGFVNSTENRRNQVTFFYRYFLSREPDTDGMFQTYLKRSGTAGDLGAFRTFLNTKTFGAAATLMLSSAEFFTNAGNNLS